MPFFINLHLFIYLSIPVSFFLCFYLLGFSCFSFISLHQLSATSLMHVSAMKVSRHLHHVKSMAVVYEAVDRLLFAHTRFQTRRWLIALSVHRATPTPVRDWVSPSIILILPSTYSHHTGFHVPSRFLQNLILYF